MQTCIVHLIRYSMQLASWKERKLVASELKSIYHAGNAEPQAFDQGPPPTDRKS